MAVSSNKNNSNANNAAPRGDAREEAAMNYAFNPLMGLMAPVGRGNTSELEASYMKAFNAYLEANRQALGGNGDVYQVELLSNASSGRILSAVVAMMKRTIGTRTVAVAIPMLLAGTCPQLDHDIIRQGNRTYEVAAVPSNQWDNNFREQVIEMVVRRFPDAVSNCAVLGCFTLPAIMKPTDDGAVADVMYHAISTMYNAMFGFMGQETPHLNIGEMLENSNSRIGARVVTGGGENTDSTGVPFRRDQVIEVRSIENRNQMDVSANVMGGSRPTELASISTYTDLLYIPTQTSYANSFMGNWGSRQENGLAPSQVYSPRVMVTDITSMALNTELSLLSLAMLPLLDTNHVWATPFRTQGVDSQLSALRSLGGLSALLPEDFPEIPAKMTDNVFRELMDAVLRPDVLLFTLLVPVSGVQTPLQRIFLDACSGSGNRASAARASLIESANILTNGHFGDYKGPIGEYEPENRVHLGYYTADNGVIMSLHNIDLLAVANVFGAKDPAVVRDWAMSFSAEGMPQAERLAIREHIINNLTGSTAVFTDYADPVTLSKEFLDTLSEACMRAGLKVARDNYEEVAGVRNFSTRLLAMGQGRYDTGLFSSRQPAGQSWSRQSYAGDTVYGARNRY